MKWQDSLRIRAAAALSELQGDRALSTDIDGVLEPSWSVVNARSLDWTKDDDLAQDLMDRGLVACTATEAHDAVHRCPRSIRNEWGMSLVAMNVGEES